MKASVCTGRTLGEMKRHLVNLGYVMSDIEARDYGRTEFFLTDDDGFNHCFGVETSGK